MGSKGAAKRCELDAAQAAPKEEYDPWTVFERVFNDPSKIYPNEQTGELATLSANYKGYVSMDALRALLGTIKKFMTLAIANHKTSGRMQNETWMPFRNFVDPENVHCPRAIKDCKIPDKTNTLDYIYHITKDGIGFNLLVRLLDGDSQSDSSKKKLPKANSGGGRGIKLPGTKSKYLHIAIQEKYVPQLILLFVLWFSQMTAIHNSWPYCKSQAKDWRTFPRLLSH